MLQHTKGIVLHSIKYGDNSLIVKVYTELAGLQTYLVRRSKSKKAKESSNLLQALSIIEMVVAHSEKNSLQKMRELRAYYSYTQIPYDAVKSSIALFLNEMLYKSIQEDGCNKNLFSFISNGLQILDLKQENCANFHLVFLIQLSRHLGFYPQGAYSEEAPYFDLMNGIYCAKEPQHPYYLNPVEAKTFYALSNTKLDQCETQKLKGQERKQLLEKLIIYYRLHTANMREIASHKVLEQLSA